MTRRDRKVSRLDKATATAAGVGAGASGSLLGAFVGASLFGERCPKCGADRPDRSTACPECGAPAEA